MVSIHRRLIHILPRWLRNALRAPSKTVKAVESSLRHRIGQHIKVRVREDWEVKCHPASADAFRAHVEIDDVREELDGFLRFVRPGMTLLDIGSHHGVFTLAAIHYGGPQSFVIAADPSFDINPIFMANVKLSGITNQVRLFESAVGSTDGLIHMLSTNAAGDHMFIASPPRSDSRQVEMLSVKSIIEKTQRIPTHIKIDVEGFENEVIRGAEDFISHYKPVIFLELHNQMIRSIGKQPREILDSLALRGYSFESRGSSINIDGAINIDLCRLIAKPA